VGLRCSSMMTSLPILYAAAQAKSASPLKADIDATGMSAECHKRTWLYTVRNSSNQRAGIVN
jgi:hypothetical protein